MAGGVAVLDYDHDGRPDCSSPMAPRSLLVKSGAVRFNRLYRNRGGWTFEDVTAKAGLTGQGYSIAAAAADFDNDGYTDLFVAGVNHSTYTAIAATARSRT